MRKFNLFNFPRDRVYVFLEETFRREFFNEAIKTTGSQSALAKKLKVSDPMIKKWCTGKNKSQKRVCEQAIPLWAVIKIYNIINHKSSIEKIQNAVIKYRARGGSSVREPNLPLVEDKCLIRIFFHLAGDGFAGHFRGSQANYFNKDKKVMKEFINDLSVFGKPKLSFKENGCRLGFPKVIGHILQHIYQTNFKSREIRFPSDFIKMERNIILNGIKALMDDEGSVEFNRICISLENKSFLSDITKLLQTKTPLRDYIRIKKSKGIPTLKITSGGMEWYKQHIGFTHSQKREDLDFYLKIKRNRRRTIGSTKIKILQSLIEREKTTREISRDIKISPSSVFSHIKNREPSNRYGLEAAGLIERKNHGNTFIWKLTRKGRGILKSSQIRNSEIGLEKYIIGFWILINPWKTINALSEFFELHESRIRKYIKTMMCASVVCRRGKGTTNEPYQFALTEKGKKWTRENIDYISTIIKVANCLGGIGDGKILNLKSQGIRYIIENFQQLKNKIR